MHIKMNHRTVKSSQQLIVNLQKRIKHKQKLWSCGSKLPFEPTTVTIHHKPQNIVIIDSSVQIINKNHQIGTIFKSPNLLSNLSRTPKITLFMTITNFPIKYIKLNKNIVPAAIVTFTMTLFVGCDMIDKMSDTISTRQITITLIAAMACSRPQQLSVQNRLLHISPQLTKAQLFSTLKNIFSLQISQMAYSLKPAPRFMSFRTQSNRQFSCTLFTDPLQAQNLRTSLSCMSCKQIRHSFIASRSKLNIYTMDPSSIGLNLIIRQNIIIDEVLPNIMIINRATPSPLKSLKLNISPALICLLIEITERQQSPPLKNIYKQDKFPIVAQAPIYYNHNLQKIKTQIITITPSPAEGSRDTPSASTTNPNNTPRGNRDHNAARYARCNRFSPYRFRSQHSSRCHEPPISQIRAAVTWLSIPSLGSIPSGRTGSKASKSSPQGRRKPWSAGTRIHRRILIGGNVS